MWPSSADASLPLTNNTSMVILSAVIASVVSEIGLGSQPAFKVPEYDFRSPGGKSSTHFSLRLFMISPLHSLALVHCFAPFFPVKFQQSISIHEVWPFMYMC